MSKVSRKGKPFEQEWSKGMAMASRSLHSSIFHHRYYDLQDYVGKRCPRCKKTLDRCGHCNTLLPVAKARPPRQPGDYFTLYRGIAILQELKSSYNEDHFPLWYGDKPAVKPHQIKSLTNCRNAGGEGILLINRRKVPGSRRMPCYAIDISDFCEMLTSATRKWLPWEDVERKALGVIPRIKPRGEPAYYDHEAFLKLIVKHHKKKKPPQTQWGDLVSPGCKPKQRFIINFK